MCLPFSCSRHPFNLNLPADSRGLDVKDTCGCTNMYPRNCAQPLDDGIAFDGSPGAALAYFSKESKAIGVKKATNVRSVRAADT